MTTIGQNPKRWQSRRKATSPWSGDDDETALMTFPEEFRQGMAARAEVLGATGNNHPDHWLGELANPELHAIVVLFARDVAERERCRQEHNRFLSELGGVDVLSTLDLEAIPPYDRGAHEHFGYRDRLSQPVIEGTGEEPTPGSEPPIKAGEFFLGYVDESGAQPALPQPEMLSRNGSYLAYLRMEEHVGAFRDFLRQHGKMHEEQGLIAAKLMGRWRSGAPLVLSPQKDDPASAGIYSAPTTSTMERWIPTATAVRSARTSGA